jgi:purine nucleoside permease
VVAAARGRMGRTKRVAGWLGLVAFGVAVAARPAAAADAPETVRVMIVTTFADEAQAWLGSRALGRAVPVPGLPAEYPEVRCGADRVCLVTVGEGHANAAASVAALVFSRVFDLRRTWWLLTGVAGIDPGRGTLGSAAWARWLVEWGLQWELDARERPRGWPTGLTGIQTRGPRQRPELRYGTELFRLDEALLRRALDLSRGVALADSAAARATRAAYPPPANRPPGVIQCDTVSADIWWSGRLLADRAEAWTRLLTAGRARYCTTQQEDNATFAALLRGDAAGLLDARRVAALRAGSNFNRPPPGGNAARNLLGFADRGGFAPALENLVRAGTPLVDAIAGNWAAWRDGVPEGP